jgi:Tol biopolymer transport system component
MPSVVLRRVDALPDRSVEGSHVRGERRSKRSRELAGDLDAIVMKALTKDPKNRYASVEQFADDVRRYLDRLPIMARRLTPLHHVRRLMRRSSRGRLAAAGLLLAIVGFTIVVSSRNRGESDRLASPPMTVSLLTTLAGSVSGPAFSADGNLIAFSWTGEGDSRTTRPGIYTVPVAGGTPMRLIAGSSGGEEWPAWSPDGSRIAFIREVRGGSGIFSVPTSGGPERKLLDLRDDRYLSLAWSPDGKHLAFADRNSRQEPYAISLLSLDTLERRRLPSPSRSSPQSILRFAFSPDGQTLAFIASGSHDDVEVGLLSLRDDKTKSIFSRREWIGGLTWTADGQALVLSLNHQGTRRLMKLPISGVAPELLPIEDAYYPALSRNGRRLAFVREVSDTDVWRIDLNGPSAEGKPVALIRSTRRDAEPRFSPDGKKIAFQSNRSGSLEVWVSDADGNNQVQLTSVNGPNVAWPSWSPDGRHIVFSGGAIYVVGSAGGPSSQLNRGETRGEAPFWSHDGSCIYFASGIIPNVWKVPAEGGQATQVTTNGAFSSRESPDGLYLYYSKNEARGIWRVPLSGGPETCVIEGFPEQFPDYWDVVDDGIYFIDSLTSPYPTIKFFSFVNGQKSTVAMLAGPAVDWGGGLTVSPDRRSILYTQSAYNRSEIVLVENFR